MTVSSSIDILLVLIGDTLLIKHTDDKVTLVFIVRMVGILLRVAVAEVPPVGTERQAVHLAVVTVVARLEINGEQVTVAVLERQVGIVVLCRRQFQRHAVLLGESVEVRDEDNLDNLRDNFRVVRYRIDILYP